jgi:hypothetical protein
MHNHRRGFFVRSMTNFMQTAPGHRTRHGRLDHPRRSGIGGALTGVSCFRLRLMFNFIQIPSANVCMLDFRGAGSKRPGFEFSHLIGTR